MGLLSDFLSSPRSNKECYRYSRAQGLDFNQSKPSSVSIIYRSEFDYISRCILDYPNIETGGQLFGYWTSTGTPIVMYAIGPGHSAQHNSTSFIQDWNYLQRIGNELYSRYRLQHIGEWHSHHQLGLAHPSRGDVNTMSYGVGKPGFPRLLLCIGNCTRTTSTLNAFNFYEGSTTDYIHALWDIIDDESPFRQIIDLKLQELLVHPKTPNPSHGQIHSVGKIKSSRNSIGVHWLTDNAENVETMKVFVTMVQSMFPEYTVKAEMLNTGEPQIVIKGLGIAIKLPYNFPANSPVLNKETGEVLKNRKDCNWHVGEEPLTISFERWLKMNLLEELS